MTETIEMIETVTVTEKGATVITYEKPTKIVPKTNILDYVAFLSEHKQLERSLYSGDLSPNDFTEKQERLLSRYQEEIHFEDQHMFPDEIRYRAFLENVGLSPVETEEIIDHERTHFQRAQELGFRALYGIWWCRGGYQPFITFPGDQGMTPGDIRDIAKTPDEPSYFDSFIC